ncbi:hypothetical protein GCM10009642_18400 [Nocardiopsis metallicus]
MHQFQFQFELVRPVLSDYQADRIAWTAILTDHGSLKENTGLVRPVARANHQYRLGNPMQDVFGHAPRNKA